MKYIGPFFRINTLNEENIENQLFYLAKESLKHIVLSSECGITIPVNDFKLKNVPNIDISTFSAFSPLVCIYKKADPKLTSVENKLNWDKDSCKKEVTITSNSFMTLCLLQLVDYYTSLKEIDVGKYTLGYLYLTLSKKQLEFYAAYLRNTEGVFVDKKDVSSPFLTDIKFEEKNKKFKFSDQALLMAAYYKFSTYNHDKDCEDYKNFSLDIFKMFLEFKEELYTLSIDEITKLCLAFNIFYKESKLEEAKLLLMDLFDLLEEGYTNSNESFSEEKVQYSSLILLNAFMLFHHTKLLKYQETIKKVKENLLELYNPELGLYMKNSEKKEVSFSSSEIIVYLLSLLSYRKLNPWETSDKMVIIDIFKHQLIESGIVLSWPEAPNLNDVERYKNFTLKSEDMLTEENFRMNTIATPENSELAPIFLKSVKYNKKKEIFEQDKISFDSGKNMYIFFLLLSFFQTKNDNPDNCSDTAD